MQKLILLDCNSHAPVKQQVHNQDNPFQVPVVHVQIVKYPKSQSYE